ncbi:hypothetical protein EVAR_23822_1 [Eumeta japonica]|uniref:Uncharacterized protein n=1 Tax=Eumeta variegata TaxID=151549 RepID=A0A4C1VLM3_EUMVA|nr:hypothetical protein EVAR_23822_1 [Eumeta japonica]
MLKRSRRTVLTPKLRKLQTHSGKSFQPDVILTSYDTASIGLSCPLVPGSGVASANHHATGARRTDRRELIRSPSRIERAVIRAAFKGRHQIFISPFASPLFYIEKGHSGASPCTQQPDSRARVEWQSLL